jgi:hypothetical protein
MSISEKLILKTRSEMAGRGIARTRMNNLGINRVGFALTNKCSNIKALTG